MRPGSRRNSQKGYSMVELVATMLVTMIGLLALVQLQIGTVRGVAHARSMADSLNLAEHFIETLKAEAYQWTGTDHSMISEPGRFPYLRAVGLPPPGGPGVTAWLKAYDLPGEDQRVGPMGEDRSEDSGLHNEFWYNRSRSFCLHYRLAWVVPDYLVRVDVRVSWLTAESTVEAYQACPVTTPGMWEDLANVSSITLSGTVMRNIFIR